MEVTYLQQLETLKYSELQRLAKGAGLKANLKADKLLKALKQHFYEIIQENRNTVNKRDSSSTDTKELDDSQIPLNVTSVTQRYRKKKGADDDQGNPERKTVHEENQELCPEKEVFSELKEREEPQDAESERTVKMNQPEYLTSSGITKNMATPSQCKERISTKCGRAERKTLVDPLSGKKPQYTTSVSKSGRTGFASTTPNFKKLHEAQFKKMQSIDDYIERKTKMIKKFSNSVNEVKMLAKKSNYLKTSHKDTPNSNSKTCSSFREFLFSPQPHGNNRVATCTPASLRRSPHSSVSNGNKSILTRKSAFNSTSLSAVKMNVRFSEATKDNEHKRSLIKTPSRKSQFLNTGTPDSQKSSTSVSRKDFRGSATKCQLTEGSNSAVTLKFEAEPISTKKPTFDLKASLSKPLGYQPHKGKLKPWGKSKENIQSVCSHRRDYRQPVPTTREERREQHEEERKLRKDKALGIRRGLTLA
ncbi:PREDICTED: nucleolar and spindle-associated protein 1 [Gekko japonicus]|uniref:Nucleolar and spindle-associated protein 1 n=1 Tax=Gekko japonicus TaxID=146911 RepID=A0ABM1LGB3_GEKJA|nr:PREDICTED: nucleolar and spindle-associated protein 1 [Gekko japonicus]